jgi:hypothetical protein
MAKKPDTPCAGGCGKLLWAGSSSLPAGERCCRTCRLTRHDGPSGSGSLVYVVGIPASTSAPVKIGTSRDLSSRLACLQRGESMPLRVAGMVGDPARLDILASHHGDARLERSLHAMFADRRVEGEWFYLGSAATAVDRVGSAVKRANLLVTHPAHPAPPHPAVRRPTPETPPPGSDPSNRFAESATLHREMFIAWTEAGFTEDQALRLLVQTVLSVE